MPKRLNTTELWREEGTGAFTSWDDVMELGRLSDGSYRLRLRRRGKDDPGTATLFRSGPFRGPERLLDILAGLPHHAAGADELPRLALPQVLIALSALVEFDPPFAAEVLRTLGQRLRSDEPSRAHIGISTSSPETNRKSTSRGRSKAQRSKRGREVVLASKDSGSMASSFTDYLLLRKTASGGLVLKLERRGMDDLAEQEWDAEEWAGLHYEVDVEGAEWLLDFLEEPGYKVIDRVVLPDAEAALNLVATVDPALAKNARRLLRQRRASGDEEC